MSHSKFLDSLNAEKRKELETKLWTIQNRKCFICEKEIDLDVNNVNIDHISPLVTGGKDEESNFALTHETCNKSKQDADLRIARKLKVLNDIIDSAHKNKEIPSLKHVLLNKGGSKYDFKYKIENETLVYSFDGVGDTTVYRTEIFTDELSNEQTAFIKVPLEYLFHDEIINPRGINSSISLLVKEFYKSNPQLHMSLARIDDGKIKVFDGQHKAVAQILLDVRKIVVRLFINPDVDRLTETNTIAGSKLKQIAFDKAILRQLHNTLYAESLKKYQVAHNLKPDDLSFSEQKVVDFFKGERGNIRVYIVNSQKDSVTHSPENKLKSYINFEGREKTLPLSYSTFEKTFLATFINAKTVLKTPIGDKMDEGLNPRVLEKDQLIELCNIIAEEILIDKFNAEIGINKIENKIIDGKQDEIPDDHLIAYRLMREEVMYNWVKYLQMVVKNYFSNIGTQYNEENLFQQKFDEQLWINIRNFLRNLRNLPLWKDHGMASTIFGGKQNYEYWNVIFNSGKAPDGTLVLAKSLNIIEMIKAAQ